MSIVVVITVTGVVAYVTALAVQYEIHRTVARQLRRAPAPTPRPALRLIVDNGRPLGRTPKAPRGTSIDLPPSAA